VKPVPVIVLVIAGAALAGWLLTLIPSPARAAAAVELPVWIDYAADLVCRMLQRATDLLRRL